MEVYASSGRPCRSDSMGTEVLNSLLSSFVQRVGENYIGTIYLFRYNTSIKIFKPAILVKNKGSAFTKDGLHYSNQILQLVCIISHFKSGLDE